MAVGRAVRVLSLAVLVGVVPSAVVVGRPVPPPPSADQASNPVPAGSLPHRWPDGTPPPADEPAPDEPVAAPGHPAEPGPTEPAPAEPGPADPGPADPRARAGEAPSDGLSVAERNNLSPAPRPPMEVTLGEPVQPPPVEIANPVPPPPTGPVLPPYLQPTEPAPADPGQPPTTQPAP